jgi:hypothetical protein
MFVNLIMEPAQLNFGRRELKMQRIKKHSIYPALLFMVLALPALAEPTFEGGIATETMEGLKAKRHAESIAIHKGRKGVKFEQARYDILVDLTRIESAEPIVNGLQKNRQLTIDQLDEIYLKLAEHLPAGIDFSIGRKSLKSSNVVLVALHFTKDTPEIALDGIDFVLDVSPAFHGGFYQGDPNQEDPEGYFYNGWSYATPRPWKWTKKTGLDAIEGAIKNGAIEVESMVVFRDKYDRKMRRKNPYREVMIYLQDGRDIRDEGVLPDYTAIFSSKIRLDQIDYLRNHPLVDIVVPNLPTKNNDKDAE